jgi:hypothetical protein
MSALALLAGAAIGLVTAELSAPRVTALALAFAALAATVTLAASFRGVPGRPTAKPFDAAVLVGAGLVGLVALPEG